MAGERYYLTTSAGRNPLPGSFAPSELLRNTGASLNLVRGRGQTRIWNLSDGLPDPAPFILTGSVSAPSEDELSSLLAELERIVKTATTLDREGRIYDSIQFATLVAAPRGNKSNEADVTITFVFNNVRSYAAGTVTFH